MKKTLNERTVIVEMTRIDLCDLLLACTALDNETDENTKKWARLHEKLKKTLINFDITQEI